MSFTQRRCVTLGVWVTLMGCGDAPSQAPPTTDALSESVEGDAAPGEGTPPGDRTDATRSRDAAPVAADSVGERSEEGEGEDQDIVSEPEEVIEGPDCVSPEVVAAGGSLEGGCCAEDEGLIVDRPDGCNWCQCGVDFDNTFRWLCTASACHADADTDAASSDSQGAPTDAAGPLPDTGTPATCPPEGADLIADLPPEEVPAGTCDPQPLAIAPELTLGSVSGTGLASEFYYHVPEAPKGLIVVFHGGGGSKEDAFGRPENALVLLEAVQAGYAIAALDSVAHLVPRADGKTKWNEEESPCNPDIRNVVALVTQLKDPDQLGLVPDNAPLYAFGVSNGGSMVSRAAQHLPFAAVSVAISNAKQFHDPGALIPPVFIIAGQEDSTVGTTGPCQLYQEAESQGIPSAFKLNVPQAVSPGLFTRIEGVECALSLSIVDAFRDAGVIDDDGFVVSDPGLFDTWQPHLPEAAAPHQKGVRDLLDERFSEHAMTSDFRAEMVTFLDAHLSPSTSADLPACL